MKGQTVHCIANKTTFQSSDYLHCLDRNDADNLYLKVHNPIVPTIFTESKEFYNTLIIRYVTWWNVMKCDEIYRQESVGKQNFGFYQK